MAKKVTKKAVEAVMRRLKEASRNAPGANNRGWLKRGAWVDFPEAGPGWRFLSAQEEARPSPYPRDTFKLVGPTGRDCPEVPSSQYLFSIVEAVLLGRMDERSDLVFLSGRGADLHEAAALAKAAREARKAAEDAPAPALATAV
jgi:hypothetical protein